MKPGIYPMTNEDYHASEGISNSGLWTIYTKSPAHYRFPPPRKEAVHFNVGNAAHDAILQPDVWETKYYRGPAARGNSNEWKNAAEFAAHNSLIILKPDDYDSVLFIRDAALAVSTIRELVQSGMIETAGFWIDAETGMLCRCKPDLYSPALSVILDIKTTADARPDSFARSMRNFGYHCQEAFYSDGWPQAAAAVKGGGPVDGWVFAAIEKEEPYEIALYETVPAVVDEGRAIYRRALATYAECMKREADPALLAMAHNSGAAEASRFAWPGYPKSIQQIDMSRWAYTLTTPTPEAE